MSRTVWIATGGTGGHIFPAVAIGEALLAADPSLRLRFVGADGGMETRLVPAAGFQLDTLPIKGLSRQLTYQGIMRNLSLPGRIWRSNRLMRRWLRETDARLVVGTGGYASFPALLAARQGGIPYVLNEQNAYPGLVTRWFAKRAQAVYAGNGAVVPHLPGAPVTVTGNPIRQALLVATDPAFQAGARARLGLDARPVLLVVGGSLGAGTFNRAMVAALPTLATSPAQVVWQCGRQAHPHLAAVDLPHNVHLLPFIDDMPAAYAVADLVICRAGALTLAELAALGKPSLLVPSPNVTDDHQTQNARSFANQGAAHMLADAQAATDLLPTALALLHDPAALKCMADAASLLGKPNAAHVIATSILQLL